MRHNRISLYIGLFLLLADICNAYCTNFHGITTTARLHHRTPCDATLIRKATYFNSISRHPRYFVTALHGSSDDAEPTALASPKMTSAGLSLRLMSLTLVWVAFENVKSISTAVRLATAVIASVDFAPTLDKQWQNIARAQKSKDGRGKELDTFRNAVFVKTFGEVVGLGMMVAKSYWACLGATIVLSSHILFWILGGGSSFINENGKHAPVSPSLVKMICAADVFVAAIAASGVLASTKKVRSIGAIAYSVLITIIATQKIKKQLKTSNAKNATPAVDSEDKTFNTTNGTIVVPHEFEEDSIDFVKSGNLTSWEYDWRSNWYPLAFSKVTSKKIPHRLELFGEPLVLWHNGTGWAALADACPHRLAPLSEGRIDESGQIECPYHGWTFTNQGTCTKIPQATDQAGLPGCGARSFRTVEKQGMIFVWGKVGATAEEADESLVPLCPALEDERFVWIDFSRDLPYSADILLENVLDSSHVCFTHHQTISKRENAIPLPLQLTDPLAPSGFHGEMAGDVAIGKTGEENLKAKRITQRTTDFIAPTYMNHIIRSADSKTLDFDAGFETWTVAYATPTGPGRSRLLARFPFRFPPPKRKFLSLNIPSLIFKYLPDWLNHLGQLKVTDDDNIFLPIQERQIQDLGGWKKYKMPTDADAFVRAYRQWYDKVGTPPYSPFAEDEYRSRMPTKEELLDRKLQHTDHCTSCSGARKNAIRIQTAMRGALLACLAFSPTILARKSWKSLSVLAFSFITSVMIKRAAHSVETSLTTGMDNYPPLRNRPNSKRPGRELRTVEQGRQG